MALGYKSQSRFVYSLIAIKRDLNVIYSQNKDEIFISITYLKKHISLSPILSIYH